MSSVSHSAAAFSSTSASDLLRSSSNGFRGLPLRTLGRARLATLRRDFTVTAKLRKVKKDRPWPEDPDPNVKGGILTHLSYFKPLKEKPKPAILDFEKPLLDLEKKIADVKKMADDTGLDFSDQILSLENKYQQALKHLYTHLTPIQRVYIARHPNRPTFLDHIFNITDKFLELHGDRQGYDDPAIVTGLGTIDGRTFMFIGHQKGRNTKENIQRNFGMPTPHGYRKALRLMRYADHHGFPIVTFIDTPGAFADLKSEELGQGEAIAQNLRSMFGLKVPIISIVIGEGGSGGALAIGCANKLLMLENAVFYVASPEACAAILWKSAKAAPEAARRLKITARELYKLKIADGVIPEPLGGAHTDPEWTSNKIKAAINKAMDELTKMDTEQLLKHRALKFRNIGGFQEGIPIDPRKKRNMKKREKAIDQKDLNEELGAEVEKLKEQVLKAVESSEKPPEQALSDMIEKLKTQVDHEFDLAFEAVGLKDARDSLKKSLSKMRAKQKTLTPVLKHKILKLDKVFNERAPKATNYANLTQKYDLLKELYWAQSLCDDARVQAELNEKWKDVVEHPDVKEKVEELKAVIQNSGASKFDDFDQELKGKIVKIKKDLEMDVSNVYRSMGFDKQNIKINLELPGEVERLSALNRRHDILSEETQKKIEEVLESSELQDMSESLELEVEKAGEEPDEAAASTIDALTEQILERLSEALRSAGLEEEWEKLEAEIDEALRDSYALDGSLEVSESEEPRKLKAENEEALSNSDASDGSLEVSESEEPRVEVNLDA